MDWIDIKNKMPKEYENVIVYVKYTGIKMAYYNGRCWHEDLQHKMQILVNITHWMSLPDDKSENV